MTDHPAARRSAAAAAAAMRKAAVAALVLLIAMAAVAAGQTAPADLIGEYVKVNQSFVLDDHCPASIHTSSFVFDQRADSTMLGFYFFNIRVLDTVRSVNKQSCTSAGSLYAIESDHPAVKNKSLILEEWATAHNPSSSSSSSSRANNIAIPALIKDATMEPFIFGYEYVQVSCASNSSKSNIRAGASYLFFQPSASIPFSSTFALSNQNKYMLMTFTNYDPARACIYVAAAPAAGATSASAPSSDPGRNATLIAKYQSGVMPNATAEPTAVPAEEVAKDSASPAPSGSVFGGAGTIADETAAAACFPARATVRLQNGSSISMHALKHGTRVHVSPRDQVSDVFMFSHRDEHTTTVFVTLHTEAGASLSVSPGHYIYVNGKLAAAVTAVVGDELWLADGSSTRILAINHERLRGLYNPQTLHGDLIVDGVVVSTYTTAVEPRFAHAALLGPARALYRSKAGAMLVGLLDYGASTLARWLPPGAPVLADM